MERTAPVMGGLRVCFQLCIMWRASPTGAAHRFSPSRILATELPPFANTPLECTDGEGKVQRQRSNFGYIAQAGRRAGLCDTSCRCSASGIDPTFNNAPRDGRRVLGRTALLGCPERTAQEDGARFHGLKAMQST